MSILTYILIFSFIGSFASLSVGLLLLIKKSLVNRITHFLISFAAGAMLGAVFFDLLPEALDSAKEVSLETSSLFMYMLGGILFFFLLERFIHGVHHHQHSESKEDVRATVALVTLGDAVHNFIDGIVIAATFMVSIPLGIVTSLAVAAHEIPQEIGDFGIYLNEGLTRKKAILLNMLSAGTAIVGSVLTYFAKDFIFGSIPYLLAITAGFFVYIALSDLIPHIHESISQEKRGFALLETFLLLFGVFVIWVAVSTLEHG